MTSRITYTLAASLVGLVIASLWLRPDRPSPPAYDTVETDRGDIALRVAATGKLSALVTVDVGSQVSGRIQSLAVDFNDRVHAGQVIARIDPALFEAAVHRAEANLSVAEAAIEQNRILLAEAQRQQRRITELRERGLVAESELDAALAEVATRRATLRSAEAGRVQAQATLNEAQTNLRYTDIISPTDGIVLTRAVNVGQTVAASLQAPILFTIAQDLAKMEVIAAVSEADIGRLESGQAVSFSVDAFPERRFAGTLRQIRNAAAADQNVVTFDAVIDVDNADLSLRPGMTATVSILVAAREDVVRVPNTALRFRPTETPTPPRQPGTATLWLPGDAGAPQPQQIEIGLSDGQYTEWRGDAAAVDVPVITGRTTDDAEPARRRFRMF
jgi:HlyD family secretion protein